MFKLFNLAALTIGALALTATQGYCAKMYQVSGKVIAISSDTVTIQKGDDQFEFTRSDLRAGSQVLKTGDEVTVFYNLQAKRASAPQQAGESRVNELAPPDQNGVDTYVPLKEKRVKDDSPFMNAASPRPQADLTSG